jgi:hypothetical protein
LRLSKTGTLALRDRVKAGVKSSKRRWPGKFDASARLMAQVALDRQLRVDRHGRAGAPGRRQKPRQNVKISRIYRVKILPLSGFASHALPRGLRPSVCDEGVI